jgi:alpha/beta superfamily hydrolase
MVVSFAGPTGTLEGYLHLPDGDGPFPGVVVCHPHPSMGGNMHNNVVMGICHSLTEFGIAALRFNFRGAGGSQGVYDDGKGEVEDAMEALRHLALSESIRDGCVGLAGYSFGAGIAMKASLRDDVTRAVALVARARIAPEEDVGTRPSLPILFVVGDQDRLMPQDSFNELSSRLITPPKMHLVPGADHFFGEREMAVGGVVADFFRHWLTPLE